MGQIGLTKYILVHWGLVKNQTHNRQVPSSSLGGATNFDKPLKEI